MGETGLEEKRKERKLKYLVVLEDQYRNKQSRSVSDLEGVGQLLQDGSGQPVPVERQRLQVRQGGQRGQQQQEGLVRQLSEAQLQADHRGGVTLQVRTQPLHVPAGQRDARQVQRPAGQGGRQHRLQAAQTDVWTKSDFLCVKFVLLNTVFLLPLQISCHIKETHLKLSSRSRMTISRCCVLKNKMKMISITHRKINVHHPFSTITFSRGRLM